MTQFKQSLLVYSCAQFSISTLLNRSSFNVAQIQLTCANILIKAQNTTNKSMFSMYKSHMKFPPFIIKFKHYIVSFE